MDTAVIIMLWMASGAFLGGVVTPLMAARKQFGDGLGALAGFVAGAAGNVVLLVPLWLFVASQPDSTDTRLMWQRDALSLQEAVHAGPVPPREQVASALVMLRENFWPAGRADGHSHRLTYAGVFAALAIITFVEVSLFYLPVPFSVVGPLVALSTSKVLLVATFFMHLRYDSLWYSAVMASTLPFAVLIVIVLALS